MSTSKSVVVSMSVAGGCALLFLAAVLLYVYVPRKASGASPTPQPSHCGAAPTVDGKTGAVTNYDKVLMPDGATCGENVAVLDKLCMNTVCTDPVACKSDTYVTYDAYDKSGHKCVQVTNPSCEQQLCDTPYCKSPSIQPPVLPPLHKRTSSTGGCINPSELEVAAMCNALVDHQYVTPDCRVVQLQRVIQTKALPNFINTTTLLSGIMLVPHQGVDALAFSYLLSGTGGTFTGMLSTGPSTDMSLCTDGEDMCLTYTIDLLPGTVRPGKYTLTLYGRPSWSAVNTMQSVQPDTVNLVSTPVDPNVTPALNVVLSRELAKNLMSTPTTLRQLLSPLPSLFPGLAMTVPSTLSLQDLRMIDASDATGAGTADAFYMAACDPTICPLGGASSKLMPYALVFIAWSPVTPLAVTQCKSSVVQYAVRKDSAKNGASIITPALATAFADLVQVGDHIKYTIVTSQGTCKSQPVVLSISIPPFTDELCHSIPISGSVLPPWMWRSDAGCVWYPDDIHAKDYYCAFEYANPRNTLVDGDGKVKLMLTDSNNECKEVLPSYPKLTSTYPAASAGAPSYCNFTDHLADVCFTGYNSTTTREATCSPALPLGAPGSGDSISNEGAFNDRVNGIITFFGLHNTLPHASVDALANDTLYRDQYYHCGVKSYKKHWGINKTACGVGDAACLAAVTNGACDTGDRNICQPWEEMKGNPNAFQQTRVCFGDPAFTSTKCCKPGEVYKFDDTLAKESVGAARGSCVASS